MQIELPPGMEPDSTTSASRIELPPGMEPDVAPKAVPVAQAPESMGDKIASIGNAIYQGMNHGLDTIATTGAKAIAWGLKDPATGAYLQKQWEKNNETYNKDPDAVKHPYVSGAGNLAMLMAGTAPLAYAGGGAVGSLFSGAVADAGIGSAGQAIAGGAGTLMGNTAQGAVMGGILPQQGQGSNPWNSQGAYTGAITGAALTPVQGFVGNYLNRAKNYGDFVNSLPASYKAPVFDTDVPANQGWYNTAKEYLVNKAVSKIPLMSWLPGNSVSARIAQQAGIEPAMQTEIGNFVNNLADKYPNGSSATFTKVIQNSEALGQRAVAASSDTFRNTLQDAGITSHKLTNSLPIINNLLDNYKTEIGASLRNRLSALASGDGSISTDELLGTAKSVGLTKETWVKSEQLLGDTSDSQKVDASNGLKNLWQTLKDDIHGSIGDNEKATAAFHTFNTVTNGVYSLWSKDSSPLIVNAVKSLNADKQGYTTFFNNMVNTNLKNRGMDSAVYQKYASMLGQEGMGAVDNEAIQRTYAANMKTGSLNVTKFRQDVQNMNGVNKSLMDSLSGLDFLAQKNAQALQTGGKSKIAQEVNQGMAPYAGALGAGGLGTAAYMIPGAKYIIGALYASGGALGAITARPALKQFLRIVNKANGSLVDNEGLANYVLTRANKELIRAGIIMTHNPDGTSKITTKENE